MGLFIEIGYVIDFRSFLSVKCSRFSGWQPLGILFGQLFVATNLVQLLPYRACFFGYRKTTIEVVICF